MNRPLVDLVWSLIAIVAGLVARFLYPGGVVALAGVTAVIFGVFVAVLSVRALAADRRA